MSRPGRRSSATQRYTAPGASEPARLAPPTTPPEAACQLAAARWLDAQARADEARDELAQLVEEHAAIRRDGRTGTVGVSRLAQLTGLSRTTIHRMADQRYAAAQSLR